MPVLPLIIHVRFEGVEPVPRQGQKDRNDGKASGDEGDLALPLQFHGVGGAGDKPLFAEDFLKEEVFEKIGTVAAPHPAGRQSINGYAQSLGEVGIKGLAVGHGGREVNSPEEQRFGRPLAGNEYRLEILPQAWGNFCNCIGQCKKCIDLIQPPGASVFRIDGVQQQTLPALNQAPPHFLEMRVHRLHFERFIQRGGVGPTHDLMLKLRIGEVIKKLVESGEII